MHAACRQREKLSRTLRQTGSSAWRQAGRQYSREENRKECHAWLELKARARSRTAEANRKKNHACIEH